MLIFTTINNYFTIIALCISLKFLRRQITWNFIVGSLHCLQLNTLLFSAFPKITLKRWFQLVTQWRCWAGISSQIEVRLEFLCKWCRLSGQQAGLQLGLLPTGTNCSDRWVQMPGIRLFVIQGWILTPKGHLMPKAPIPNHGVFCKGCGNFIVGNLDVRRRKTSSSHLPAS